MAEATQPGRRLRLSEEKTGRRQARVRRLRARRRRTVLVAAIGSLLAVFVLASLVAPSSAPMTPEQHRIVSVASRELGYRTDPRDSYCNRFTALFGAGTSTGCPAGESAEEWCADFAIWVWEKAGLPVTYGYGPDQLNGAAVSFYQWAVAHHRWHPAAPGYVARPGDVAVYGLKLRPILAAAHVGIVVADPAGQSGPDVIDGDGDRGGFSLVELVDDQLYAQANSRSTRLSGYVSPPAISQCERRSARNCPV